VPAAFGSRLRRGRRHAASLPTTLVVGIASGASAAPPGVLAMHCVQASHGRRTDLRFAQATAPPAVLAADLVAGELIAIGEARLGAAPGRVSMLAGAAADRLLSAPEYATAAPGLLEALAQLEEAGRPPRHRAVLNIEPAPIASRYAPRFMAASVAQAAAQVIALVEAWRLFARITVRAGDDGCLLLRGD
jgi:uncharacterized membrane protein